VSRARFVDSQTGEDIYLYDNYTRVYYCLFCREYGKQAELYNVAEMIDHKFKVHHKAYINDNNCIVRYEIRPGHETFTKLMSV